MKNNFNSVAWCYDRLSWIVFGNKLKQSQKVLLDHVMGGSKILILGGGTGWMLHELLEYKAVGIIDYVEASEKMIERTKQRIPIRYHSIINFIHGQEDQIKEHSDYDCVIACYFFDLFSVERQEKIIMRIKDSMKKEGRLLVADFCLSETSPFAHRILLRMMYLFFGIVANIETDFLSPFRKILKDQFLKTDLISESMQGFILSEVYERDKN